MANARDVIHIDIDNEPAAVQQAAAMPKEFDPLHPEVSLHSATR
jgi:hypothetical protein